MQPFTIKLRGKIETVDHPWVMGILNVTDDSFYGGSRAFDEEAVATRVRTLLDEGADAIDVGACSTRPGCACVTAEEERRRLDMGMRVLRSIDAHVPVSVDTFRADIARHCVEDLGVDIINDISGAGDPEMAQTVAELGVPYVLMHMRGTPSDMQRRTDYGEDVAASVLTEMSRSYERLVCAGVGDIIIDPGFGFAKTLEQNYELMRHLDAFAVFGRPIFVGISRKSMITRLLDIPTDAALNATTALNTIALERGAAILRVHDVRAAKQAVTIYEAVYGRL